METNKYTYLEMLTNEELKEAIIYHTYMGKNTGDSVYAEIHRQITANAQAELERREHEIPVAEEGEILGDVDSGGVEGRDTQGQPDRGNGD